MSFWLSDASAKTVAFRLSRRWWAVVIVASVVTCAWLVRESLLRGAAALWIVSDAVTRADAIVVLGGNYQVRPRLAVDLYRRGLANRILVSETGDGQRAAAGSLPTNAELNRAALFKLGVPPDAVESFGAANVNTREEAIALREWAARNGASKVIVPSEIFSARRVRWIIRRELSGSGVATVVLSFDPPGYTRTDWWKTENGVLAFQSELLKYAYYRLNY